MADKLTERQEIEKEYHDKKYKDDLVSTSHSGESSSYIFFHGLVGEVKGLRVLDYGCGTGWVGLGLARSGAEVYGIDISKELIKKALQYAERENLSNKVSFQEMPAENLTFPDTFFDLIVGSAILHHLDISIALKGISRVLKPGGRALFIEPMNQNIVLKIWRKLTPWRRSPTERALDEGDLKLIRGIFPESKFYFFTFFSIVSEGLLVLSPSNKLLLLMNGFMEGLDKMLLKAFPALGKYSAVVVMDLQKGKK